MTRSVRALIPVFSFSVPAVLATSMLVTPVMAQTNSKPAEIKAAPTDKGAAYYNFSMGHLYSELAGAYGNRGDYLNKAIEYYKLALKQDPSATFLSEELTDLYIQSGQLNRAVTEAEEILRQNPNNLDARRMLGRIYTRLIGDQQQNKIDEKMLNKAIEQYKIVVEKDPKDQDSLLTLGRLYRVSHNSVEAEKIYKAVLATDADNEEALTGLAGVYSDVGDTKGAIEMLRRASEKDPNPRALSALASFYEQGNDFANAAQTWKRVLPLVQDSSRVKRMLAQDLLYSDNVDEALPLFKELSEEDPRDPLVQLRLSEIYRQKHDLVQARAALAKVKSVDSDNIEVRYEEVNLLEAEGKPAEAIQTLKGILDSTTKKDYTEADKDMRRRLLMRLGLLYRSANQYPNAVTTFRQLGELDPERGAASAVQVVETYRIARNLSSARQEADAALKKYPKDRTVVVVHASLLADMGKPDQAVSELRQLMQGGEKDRDLLLTIAQIYEKSKKFPEEQKVLDEAETASSTKQEKQNVQFARGAMYERMKDFGSAEKEFRKVLNGDPDNAGALNYLGYMLADQNTRLDEAQKLVSRAVELEPQNGAYLDSLGWVQYRQNQLDQAEMNLQKALEKIGTDPTVHDHLGDVYMKEGKLKDAVAQWQASLKEWEESSPSDTDSQEVAKVTKKLESARVKLAKESHE